ncbi:hypothetical protein [Nocardia transvalensis]|uniref:hypothetical protein n=1 Tax=Nocardia transvalensis TaxID=37333 RepID=UPI001895E6B4|nr:hypothetical protein [Nocardia transvalensis]MBF6331434.1 hypothetical protein [Nocardia transvalensis]
MGDLGVEVRGRRRTAAARRSAWGTVLQVLAVWLTVATVCAGAVAPAASAEAVRDNSPAVVGFWAGERFLVPGGPSGYPSDPDQYWAERDPSVWTAELWTLLQRHRVPIYFHLRYGRDFGTPPPHRRLRDDALPILRQADQRGIPVFAWVTVPYEDGYWATQDNAPVQLAATAALDDWVRHNDLRLAGVAYDMEPPLETINALVAGRFDPAAQARFIDPAAQCRTIRQYETVFDDARAHFGQVVGAPVPFALDDLANGDLALQNALGLWGLPQGPRALYFQAYRSTVADVIGADPGTGFVAHYLRRAQQVLGPERGQVTLGVAGEGIYRDLGTLIGDIRLARALGADTIPIYSLETAVTAYGVDGVEQLIRAGDDPLDHTRVRAAEQSTPQLEHYLALITALDAGATQSTPVVTAARGASQQPNRYPGCAEAE